MERRKIGLMGGTFDPIHIAHLLLGEKAYEQYHLDQVLFMPSGRPPHKRTRTGGASDEQRVDMVRLAIEGNPHFGLSLDDMDPDDYSYSYRTLEKLKEAHPDTDYYFIIGGDSLFSFDTWVEPARICKAASLLVATRDQVPMEGIRKQIESLTERYNGTFLTLSTPNMDISSAQIRAWVHAGNSIRYYVPDPVREYMQMHHLYEA